MPKPAPPTVPPKTAPLVVTVAREADGYTYSLRPESEVWLKTHHPAAQGADRIFIAQDVRESAAQVFARLAPRLLPLLTGLSEAELAGVGPIPFYEPRTQAVLFTWRAGESTAQRPSGTP